VGGSVKGGGTICAGQAPPLLRLEGKDGNVIRWEQSANNGLTWTQIANTSINYQPGALTTTTFFRSVVRKGTCAPARSLEAKVVVNSNNAVGGSIALATQNICSGDTPAFLTLSGQTGSIVRWESSKDSVTWTAITNTTTTLTPPALSATTWYRAVLQGTAGCPVVFSKTAKIIVTGSGSPGEVNELTQNGCADRNSGTLTLTNFSGTILRWEFSVDPLLVVWDPISNNTNRLTYDNLPVGETYYRAVVQQPGCNARYSEIGVVKISPASVGGAAESDIPLTDVVDDKLTLCDGEFQFKPKITLTGQVGQVLRWEYLEGDDPDTWPGRTDDPVKDKTSNKFLLSNSTVLDLLDTNLVVQPTDNATFGKTNSGRRLKQTIMVRAVVKNGNCEEAFSDITIINIDPGFECCTAPNIKPNVPEVVYGNVDNEESTDVTELWTVLNLKLDFKVGTGKPSDTNDPEDHIIFARNLGNANFDGGKALDPADKPWYIGEIIKEDIDLDFQVRDNQGYQFYIVKQCSLTVVPASKLISDTVTCWVCTRVNPERLNVDGVTDTTARISWFDQSSGSRYIVKWRVRDPNPGNNNSWYVSEVLDSTKWEIPNLTPQSKYEVQVIKLCYDGTSWVETSEFSQSQVKERTYKTKDFTTTGTTPTCANFDMFNWAKSGGSGTGNDIGRAVATDKDGFIYVVGSFKGNAQIGSFTLTSANAAKYDNYIAKYDNDGTPIWVRRFGSGASAEFTEGGNSIVVDMSGNVFVTGRFYGSAAFGNTVLTSVGDADVYVAKMRATDGTLLWVKRAGGQLTDAGFGIELDKLGNVFVAGKVTGNATFGNSTLLGPTSNSDAFIAGFKQADGAFVWARRAGNVDTDDAALNISIDNLSNIYFSGYVGGSARNPNITFGTFNISNGFDVPNAFVARYNSQGEAEWVKTISKDYSVINGIAVDPQGNIATCGWFQGTVNFGGVDETSTNQTSGPNPSIDMFIAKWDGKSGRELFIVTANDFANVGDEYARGLRVDNRGDMYITGHFNSPQLKLGSATLSNFSGGFGKSDFFVGKISGNGTAISAINGGSDTNDDGAYGIALDRNGLVYIAGDYKGNGLFPKTKNQSVIDTLVSNAGTWDGFLAQISCEDPIKCDLTPRVVYVANIDNNTVSVNWYNEGGAVKSYDLRYRALNSQMWSVKTGVLAPPYIIGNLFAGQKYEVQIRANCTENFGGSPEQKGPSLYSDPIPFETIGVGTCPAPTGLTVDNVFYNEAILVWDRVPGAAFYEISYRKLATEIWATVRADSNSIKLENLAENTRYEVRVRSRCTDRLSSSFSSVVRFSTLVGDCPLPNNLTASMITPNSAQATWSLSVTAVEYNIQWRKVGTSTWSTATTTQTTYKINFLENNTQYEYRVRAVCGATTNTSPYTERQVFTTSPACEVPFGIQVLDVSKNTITVGWEAVPGAMIYYVEYKTTLVSGFQVDSSYTNQIVLENLESGTRYDIRLRTNCGNDNLTDVSQIVNGTTINFCEAPTELRSVEETANSMILSWVGPTDAVGYKLEFKQVGELNFGPEIVLATNTYSMTNLVANTEYEIRILTICKDGSISEYTAKFFKTQPCNPPSNFRVDQGKTTPTEVTLKWDAVPGAVEYTLFYRDENGNENTLVVTGTTWTIKNLVEGTKYSAILSVDCGNGTIASSTLLEFTTAQTCAKPTDLKVVPENITCTAAPISWIEVPGATGYIVYWKLNNDIDPIQSTSLLPTNAYVITGLTPKAEYKVWVETRCGTQTSEKSEEVIFMTKECALGCFTPNIITPISIFRNFATVNWAFVPEAINYTISWRRIGVSQWTSTTINDPNTTAFTLSNLFCGTTYVVRVRARCPFGFTDWSEAQFTTLPCGKEGADLTSNNISIYPNPNNGAFSVNFDSQDAQEVNFKLLDLTGRSIVERTYQATSGKNEVQFELNGYASGVYMLHIVLNGETKVIKVVVE